jgi:hypothetical protein
MPCPSSKQQGCMTAHACAKTMPMPSYHLPDFTFLPALTSPRPPPPSPPAYSLSCVQALLLGSWRYTGGSSALMPTPRVTAIMARTHSNRCWRCRQAHKLGMQACRVVSRLIGALQSLEMPRQTVASLPRLTTCL